jgi:hypothetical protein
MIFGSTRVDVLRSIDTENGRGDPVESDDVALAGLPVDIAERTKTRRDPANGHLVTISGVDVAVRASCPFVFKATDRLRDQRTGAVLQVETITTARSFAGRRRVLFCTESG